MADASQIESDPSGGSMDTSPIDSPPLPDVLPPGFVPVIVSARSEAGLRPNSSTHLGPLYMNEADRTNTITAPMHVSVADISPPAAIATIDLLTSTSLQPRPTAPGFIPDFPPSCDIYSGLPTLEGSIGMEPTLTLSASGSPQPQIQSSSVLNTSSIPAGLSSLASALDSGLSRSGGEPTTLSKNLPPGFISTSSASSTSSPDPNGIVFPTSGYGGPMSGISDEAPGDSHMLALENMFASIAMTAHSARNTCSQGSSAQTGAKINELLQAISTVAQMFEPLSISDASPPPQQLSAPLSNSSASPPILTQITPEHTPPYASPPDSSDLSPMDVQDSLEHTDLSRKRCASATPTDRVIKALKREPNDDGPLGSLATYPSGTTVYDQSSSAPPSRPPTPGSLSVPYGVMLHPSSVPTSNLNLSQVLESPPSEFSSMTVTAASTPPFRRNRSSWSDHSSYTTRQHQHSHSGGTINSALPPSSLNGAVGIPPSLPVIPSNAAYPNPAPFPVGAPPLPARAITNSSASQPLGRISRSGSIAAPNSFAFTPVDPYTSMESYDLASRPPTSNHSPESDDDDDDCGQDQDQVRNGQMSSENGGNVHSNEVPLEYREEVDRVFFEFLNKICSNLDSTDSKGEAIHQTLMAKKMQRLDESPDFRPFKFRIAAFTNAFLEELAQQGYPEEKIPMKKIRNYLWKQPHIQRFNEDGKKSKSKGNHIWNIDAKKMADGRWKFRPFQRRLAGNPPGVAYVGLLWSWMPRIWDPQASSTNLPVQYTSPVLPSWLSWKDDALSGTPPPDAESCEITAEAKFTVDGAESRLSLTFTLHIAPMSSIDPSYSASRRPSISGEMRRVVSDSIVPQAPSTRPTLPLPSSSPMTQTQQPTHQSSQVMHVLASAAQRVAQEAQSQVIASMTPNEVAAPQVQAIANQELQSLAKQQHVLSAAAFDVQTTAGQRVERGGTSQPAKNSLAAAAQQVVLQAAISVRADRSAAAGTPASQATVATPVTVNEVSVKTQSAVAQAVEITGPMSSEVHVLMTASSLLQHHALDPTRMIPGPEPPRPHSTGALLAQPYIQPLPGPTPANSFPPLRPLGMTEYGQP